MPHYVWIFIFIFSISTILVQFHSLQELCFALDTMARICVDITSNMANIVMHCKRVPPRVI